MRVKIIKSVPNYTVFKALEEGSIITSAGNNPGPEDMQIYIHKGETFGLHDIYLNRNNLTILHEKKP